MKYSLAARLEFKEGSIELTAFWQCRTAKIVIKLMAVDGGLATEHPIVQLGIDVDEVVEHKPPDRAIPFTGKWEDVIISIHGFRR